MTYKVYGTENFDHYKELIKNKDRDENLMDSKQISEST